MQEILQFFDLTIAGNAGMTTITVAATLTRHSFYKQLFDCIQTLRIHD